MSLLHPDIKQHNIKNININEIGHDVDSFCELLKKNVST